jgi:DNA transformation protein
MASKDTFATYCAELFGALGPVRVKRMFGGHGIYVDDVFIAIVAGETLYLKANGETSARFESAGCQPFRYTAKGRTVSVGYWSAPAQALDSPAAMRPWALLALQAARVGR